MAQPERRETFGIRNCCEEENEDNGLLDNVVGFDEFESILCCCKHDTPHDEYLKFKLIASEEHKLLAPFKYTPKGNLIEQIDSNAKCTIPRISNDLKIYQRNDEIQ